jgi:DNA-binding SARP family transcriptional activator
LKDGVDSLGNEADDKILHIHMLGDLTIRKDDEDITSLIKRSDNLLKLLCYLVMLKGKTVSATELTDIVFVEQEYENPVKAVNNLIYRLRKMIDSSEAIGYIRRTGDGYSWNMTAPFTLDILDFEYAADEGIRSVLAGEPDEAALQQSIDLYKDDFLREMVYEHWTVPTRQNYKNKFLRCVDELIKVLRLKQRNLDIINICDKAIAIDPYCERLHVAYLDALLAEDRVAHATRHYSYITKLLYNEFGVYASEELKAVYARITGKSKLNPGDIDIMQTLGDKEESDDGPFFCDYDMFKKLYSLEERRMQRNGQSNCMILYSLTRPDLGPLPPKMQSYARESLKSILIAMLRKGDIACFSNEDRAVIYLNAITYEAAVRVSERILVRFAKEVDKSQVVLHYRITPVEPKNKD